ncbi:hypothetical protein [Carnobacterium maltaromaticum]|uniref:hypothetical protein n=1 Tax=Carnobacterium maltaromaticum TaxID=2751 RepID=UPI00165CA748|nr:hypothetical protein [Carnobacterium maltaromaticum]MBC9788592.1 hypothetical protein [Carnobacterium maltaromaticum]
MNENTAKITIELNAKGGLSAEMEGTTEDLLAMLEHCIGETLQAGYCCEGHYELRKIALLTSIMGMEVKK